MPYPRDVDPLRREFHLSDADFEKLFGMTKKKYLTLQPWKRTQLKKKVGLF